MARLQNESRENETVACRSGRVTVHHDEWRRSAGEDRERFERRQCGRTTCCAVTGGPSAVVDLHRQRAKERDVRHVNDEWKVLDLTGSRRKGAARIWPAATSIVIRHAAETSSP